MRLPKYPRYKRAKAAEWLGQLPEHWRVTRCREIFRERKEFSTTGEEQLLSVSEYYGIKPRSEVVDEGDFLTRAATLEGYRKCHPRDLVMNYMLAWKSGLGCTDFDGIVSPAYAVFEVRKSDFHYRYYHYLLRTPLAATEFKRFSYGIIDSRLRLYPNTFLGAIFVSVPPITEQRTIADFLDRETGKIDMLAGKKRELIEKLKEKRTALISRIVTRGLNPKVKLKRSGIEWLGDVPHHWGVKPLRHAATRIQTGSTPPTAEEKYYDDGSVPWFGPGSFGDAIILTNPVKLLNVDAIKEGAARLFRKGATMVVTIGATLGKVSSIETNASCNQQITVIETKRREVHPRFITYQLKRLEHTLRAIAPSATLPILAQGEIAGLPVAIPRTEEQAAIADYLDRETAKIDEMIEKVEAAIEKLQEYRTALITAAVTGKIDVRNSASAADSSHDPY